MKLFLIDWTNLLHRSYYSAQKLNMTNQKWDATWVIFLTLKSIMRLKKEVDFQEGVDKMIFTLDNKESKRYRLSIFEWYKATRNWVKDEDFFKQIWAVKEILNYSDIDVMEQKWLEADDLCWILANWYKNSNKVEKIHIFSSDKDYYQILDENQKIEILRPQISWDELYKRYNYMDFLNEYLWINTNQFVQLKALIWDKSDNIIGIHKIWEGTGLKIIKEYESLSKLIEDKDWYKKMPKWLREEIPSFLEEWKKWSDYLIEHYNWSKISIKDLLIKNYNLAILNYKYNWLTDEERNELMIKISNLMKKSKNIDEIQRYLNYFEIKNFTAENL